MINLTAKGKYLVRKLKKELESNGYICFVPPETKWHKGILGFDGIYFREDGVAFFESTVKSQRAARLKRIFNNPFYQRFKDVFRFELWLFNPKTKKFIIEKL